MPSIAHAHRFELPTSSISLRENAAQRHFSVVQRHPSRPKPTLWSSSTLAAPVLHICRGGNLELGALPETEYLQSVNQRHPELNGRESRQQSYQTALFRRSMYKFDACERDMAIRSPLVSPPPVSPSLLPAPPERRVRLARCSATTNTGCRPRRPSAAERRGTDAFSDYEATPRVLDAPPPRLERVLHHPGRPYPRHPRVLWIPRRCPSSTHAPPSLTPWAQRRSLAVSMCNTNVASRSSTRCVHFPSHTHHLSRLPILGHVIDAKASASTRGRSNAADETIDSGSTSVQAPRTKPGSGAISILAAAAKNVKNADDGGRGRERKTEGGEEDESAGGEIPRFFFLLDSSSIQSTDLLNGVVSGDNTPGYVVCWIGRASSLRKGIDQSCLADWYHSLDAQRSGLLAAMLDSMEYRISLLHVVSPTSLFFRRRFSSLSVDHCLSTCLPLLARVQFFSRPPSSTLVGLQPAADVLTCLGMNLRPTSLHHHWSFPRRGRPECRPRSRPPPFYASAPDVFTGYESSSDLLPPPPPPNRSSLPPRTNATVSTSATSARSLYATKLLLARRAFAHARPQREVNLDPPPRLQ
ncbi:hypothetical protein K438DRAFT_1954269 [Mycena galopus ATCC 62051]|nr:hypothetical protein K438DRAFT_1954269 [Mycena galopus ATCC 62051]